MKKIFAVLMTVAVMGNAFVVTANADQTSNAKESVEVYVTISDEKGEIVVAQEKINVTDVDEDGAFTINDALYMAHEEKYEGGADKGYESSYGSYGLSLTKLWGVSNGGSYGYYVNNKSAWSLTDVVEDGDYINAFIYTDLTTWSDTYCYFDINSTDKKEGEDIELVLTKLGFDENYNTINMPVENATITFNGEKTEYKTDENGKVKIKFNNEGSYVISAVSDTVVLVPPVCKVLVTALETTNPGKEESETTVVIENHTTTVKTEVSTTVVNENGTQESTKSDASPKTGDTTNHIMVILFMTVVFSTVVITSAKVRKNEK